MIVELFGPSGTGKSYFATRLADERKLPRIRVRFGQKYLLAALFAWHNRQFVRRLLHIWNRETRATPILRGNKLYRMISFMAKEQKARLSGGGIIDEGIIQYFLLLYEAEAPIGEIRDCLALLHNDNYLVCIIESDFATRFRRMEERGKVSRWELGDAYVRQWHRLVGNNAALLKPVLTDMFRCEIICNN